MASPNANAANLSKYVIKLHGTAEQLKAAGAAAGQTHPLLKKTVNPFADPNCQALEVVNTLTGKAPQKMQARRMGNDLQVRIDDDEEGLIIALFKDYFPQGGQLVGLNDAGQYVQYQAGDGQVALADLADGVDYQWYSLGGEVADLGMCLGTTSDAASWQSWAMVGGGILGAFALGGSDSDGGRPTPAPDTTAPNAPTATVAGDGVSVSGAAEPGSTVTIYGPDGTTVLGTAVAAADGSYSVPLVPALTNGEDITATATDAAGNASAPTSATAPDTTAPAAPAAPANYNDNVGAVTSPTSTAGTTDDTMPGVNIGAGLTDVPTLYVDGVKVPATYDPVTGTLTPTTPLAEGAHALTYTLTDAAGNESLQSGPLSMTVDTTAPGAPTAPTAPTSYNDNVGAVQSPTSTAATTDDTTPGINIDKNLTDTPTLYVDGVKVPATYDPATGTLTPTTPLGAGAHSITYTLSDAAGNESTPSPTMNLTIDTTPPFATVSSVTASPTTVNEGSNEVLSVNLSSTAGNASLSYAITGTGITTGDFGTAVFSNSVTLNGDGTLNVPTGVSSFTITLPVSSDSTTEGSETASFNVGGQSASVVINDTSTSSPGQSVISLGTLGQLILPVQVEGHWYYVWDRNSDGIHGGVDYITMDALETLAGIGNIDESNRTFTLNGVQLRLPTDGLAGSTLTSGGYKPGTSWSNATPGWNTDHSSNATYDDLYAIWDAFNGTGSGTNMTGVPSGWDGSFYWSATPSASGHAGVYLDLGVVTGGFDGSGSYVAFEVL